MILFNNIFDSLFIVFVYVDNESYIEEELPTHKAVKRVKPEP